MTSQPAAATTRERRGRSWPVPAGLLALSAVPLTAGTLRLIQVAGGPDLLPAGEYTLAFRTGAYFAALGMETFYPFVTVTFSVEIAADGTSRHYHVPLLLSPFAYSTYRGS